MRVTCPCSAGGGGWHQALRASVGVWLSTSEHPWHGVCNRILVSKDEIICRVNKVIKCLSPLLYLYSLCVHTERIHRFLRPLIFIINIYLICWTLPAMAQKTFDFNIIFNFNIMPLIKDQSIHISQGCWSYHQTFVSKLSYIIYIRNYPFMLYIYYIF